MKTVIVTGSTRSIDFGLADAFLTRSCAVVISGCTNKLWVQPSTNWVRSTSKARLLGSLVMLLIHSMCDLFEMMLNLVLGIKISHEQSQVIPVTVMEFAVICIFCLWTIGSFTFFLLDRLFFVLYYESAPITVLISGAF